MADRLAFVERPEDLALVPANARVVALTPLVDLAAGERALSAHELAGAEALEELGRENFRVAEQLVALLDAALVAQGVPATGADGPARWHFFGIKRIVDAVTLTAAALRAALEAEAPREVDFFPCPAPPGANDITQDESLAAPVLACLLPALGIAARPHQGAPPSAPATGSSPAPPAAGRPRDIVATVLREIGERARGRPGRGRPRVLCLDASYGTAPIAAQLMRMGSAVFAWTAGTTTRRLGSPRRRHHAVGAIDDGEPVRAAWREVASSEEARALLRDREADLWPALEPLLERLVLGGFADAVRHHRAATTILDDLRPDAVLVSMAAWPRERAASAAARQAGVPVVVSRHGELGTREAPMAAYEDLDAVDAALCWGEWESSWIGRHAHRSVEARVVGSPMVERSVGQAPPRPAIRRTMGLASDERVVLYVPTNLDGNHWYAGRRVPPNVLHLRHQAAVLRSILAHTDLRVLVKEHPAVAVSPLEEWARVADLAAGDRVRLVRRPGFERLVNLADAVVLDFPSTTLVQALYGQARVYLVDHPILRWETGVLEFLQKHGLRVGAAGEIGRLVATDAAAGDLGAGASNRAALEPLAHGGADPGGAAARAARAVVELTARPA